MRFIDREFLVVCAPILRYPEPSREVPYDRNFARGTEGQAGRTSRRVSIDSPSTMPLVGGGGGGGGGSPGHLAVPADFVYRDGLYRPSYTGNGDNEDDGGSEGLPGAFRSIGDRNPQSASGYSLRSPRRSSLDMPYSPSATDPAALSPMAPISGRLRRSSLDLPTYSSLSPSSTHQVQAAAAGERPFMGSPKGSSGTLQPPGSTSGPRGRGEELSSSGVPRSRRESLDMGRSSAGQCKGEVHFLSKVI